MKSLVQAIGFRLNWFFEKSSLVESSVANRILTWFYYSYKRIFEARILHLFEDQLTKYDLFVDVGLGLGFYTRALAHNFRELEFIGFEPDSLNFQRSKMYLDRYPNVTLINKAVSDSSGSVTFLRDRLNPANHRVVDDGVKHTDKIDSVILDSLVSIEKKCLIKIDVQGHEFAVLMGAKKLLDSKKNAWFVEFDPQIESTERLEMIWNLFESLGYTAKVLSKGKWVRINTFPLSKKYFDIFFEPKLSRSS